MKFSTVRRIDARQDGAADFHRFSTVKMADRILVLEAGQIAEEGATNNCLLRGGRYAEMFELQAASYR